MAETCVHNVSLSQECKECGLPQSLVAAAKALLEHDSQVAEGSYREWDGEKWIWNDEIWAQEEPEQFELIRALRHALRYEWIRA